MKNTANHRRDSDGDATSTTATSSSTSIADPDAAALLCSPENFSLMKPHRSSDSAFEAIVSASNRRRSSADASAAPGLSYRDFKLVRRIGSGDIGTVYLCRLRDGACEYAMKVVDREAVAMKNKTQRAETEKLILKMLDHPFLPTLYAEFNVSNLSCIVMEYCPGGDLHSLRHRQPSKRFSLSSARFYAAEVLVALEYLHMLGIIYRDLKPENVLVRSDGHIMLSDFDLSLCSDSVPAVQFSSYSTTPDQTAHNLHPPSPKNYPSTPFSCLPNPNRFFRSRKIQTLIGDRLFVAEPVSARSCSFVGTHEYVPPEVASGGSHGNAIDWWALGIFIYEMIYGRTPFVGPTNEATLRSILKKPLSYPTPTPSSASEAHARDLISGLLSKDPSNRVGSKCGAAEIKTHPFFNGLNFALVRSLTPPAIPEARRHSSPAAPTTSFKARKESTAVFDLF